MSVLSDLVKYACDVKKVYMVDIESLKKQDMGFANERVI